MKFDTIIIGGGLAGLTAGISLSKKGQRTAIISTGQSALHFSSGSLELLSSVGDKDLEHPLEGVAQLPSTHPYQKIGVESLERYAQLTAPMFAEAGIKVNGDPMTNHWRITPLGAVKRAWLSFDDHAMITDPACFPWKRVALVTFPSFPDFYPNFLKTCFEKHGVEVTTGIATLPTQYGEQTTSRNRYRASGLERALQGEALLHLGEELHKLAQGADAVFMPAVVGLGNQDDIQLLRRTAGLPVYFMPTMPTSVPGIRAQRALQSLYRRLGGTQLQGHSACRPRIEDGRVKRIYTNKLGSTELVADNYILASGSFFSNGLKSYPNEIVEPLFGLDTNAPQLRPEWYQANFFAQQPYMGYGVLTDNRLHPLHESIPVSNLYAVGSLLASGDPIAEGSGAGIAICTAMYAAESILNTKLNN